jgi:hypothetical protein
VKRNNEGKLPNGEGKQTSRPLMSKVQIGRTSKDLHQETLSSLFKVKDQEFLKQQEKNNSSHIREFL